MGISYSYISRLEKKVMSKLRKEITKLVYTCSDFSEISKIKAARIFFLKLRILLIRGVLPPPLQRLKVSADFVIKSQQATSVRTNRRLNVQTRQS